jgi:tungstate transport system substrate-binding protein
MRRPRKTFMLALVLAVAVTVWITGCGNRAAEEAPRAELILATTTSTQDSGLLDAWIPMFEEEYPYSVKVIAVGSGKAMEMGRNGECDVMLVHSPGDEVGR